MPYMVDPNYDATWTGTGTGAMSSMSSIGTLPFSDASGTVTYMIVLVGSPDIYEIGTGVASAGGTALTRAAVLESSNSNALVNFGAGTKLIFLINFTKAIDIAAIDPVLISVVWGSPGSESSEIIEVAASCVDFNNVAFASGIVEVEIKVTDSAADAEPSATATLAAAATPVGTLLSGTGTATVVMRTNASGLFKVAVTEATATVFRYLWIKQGGNARLWVRSSTGVLELSFT